MNWQSDSPVHSQLLRPLLPHTVSVFQSTLAGLLWLLSKSSTYFYLVGKGCDSRESFSACIFEETNKGDRSICVPVVCHPLNSSVTLFLLRHSLMGARVSPEFTIDLRTTLNSKSSCLHFPRSRIRSLFCQLCLPLIIVELSRDYHSPSGLSLQAHLPSGESSPGSGEDLIVFETSRL